ncbi:DUF1877 family protein [Corynebacterium sp. H113]|uniref:DUF1877 family protein n=1 Tax=Corynebacterium sp. H113 TaxID=3133419 RepID=UPI0030A5D50D
MGMCAEYLRLSESDVAHLQDISAPAATREGGTAGLVGAEAKSIILRHFENIADDDALDIDTDWESLLMALTGKPLDGQALGDPLGEAILGADRVCRDPLSSVIDADRVKVIAETLSTIDIDTRIEENGTGSDSADTVRTRFAQLAKFYADTAHSGDAMLVTIE